MLALLTLLMLRLWFVQVIGGEQYARAADDNRLREVVQEAPRGVIKDRDGRILVTNRVGQNVVLIPDELEGARRQRVLGRLAPVLKTTVPRLRAVLARARQANLPPYQSVVLDEDVNATVQSVLAERKRDFPGITLKPTYIRKYPQGELAAHVLGYVTAIPRPQEADYLQRGYGRDERIGQEGVEQQYESYLRGTPGSLTVEVDARGEPTERGVVSSVQPEPGRTLYLTIDLDVQRALERALVTAMNRTAYSDGASGVVLDPRTGEVLAMASFPTFRPAAFADNDQRAVRRILAEQPSRLLNRAIGGLYPPGSTFKAVTATTALETPPGINARGQVIGGVSADELIAAPGTREFYGTDFDGFGGISHGTIPIRTALEVSSDTFFYEIANRFYNMDAATPMQDWSRRFGLDEPLGIDIPGEAGGTIPDRAYLAETFPASQGYGELARIWKPGNSINMSIGQGYVTVTPLQMAQVYAAVAEDGTIHTPSLARQVRSATDALEQDLLRDRPTHSLGARPQTINVIKDGLFLAANGDLGTSTAIFGQLPEQFTVAGKTGTSENASGIDHSWYVGYAPSDDPQVVVSVVIQKGGTGANSAAPAVCQTMAAYFRYDPNSCGTPSAESVN